MKLFILSILLLVSDFAYGQVSWEYFSDGGNNLSDLANDIEELPDGFIITGNLDCPDSNVIDRCGVFLLKLDLQGNELWRKNYDFEGSSAESIEITSDGGYLLGITCYKESGFGLIDAEIVVMKTDGNGEIEWTKIIDDGTYEYELSELKVTPDVGGFILVGSVSESDSEFVDSYFDVYVYKGNDLGDMEWDYFYGGEAIPERGVGIDILNGGGYVIGATESIVIPGQSHSDFLIVRISDEGEEVWTNTFTGNDYEKVTSIIQAQDGNILVGGAWEINSGGTVKILKIDANTGEEIWGKFLYNSAGSGPHSCDIALSNDGGVIIGGRGLIAVFKLDENGNQEWSSNSQTTEYYERIYEIKEADDGGIIAVGEYRNNGQIGNRDIYVIKMNSMGELTGADELTQYEENKISIELYPNPVDDYLVIKSDFESPEEVLILVHDASGKEVLQVPYLKSNNKIDLKGLVRGHYFLRMYSDGLLITGVKSFQKI